MTRCWQSGTKFFDTNTEGFCGGIKIRWHGCAKCVHQLGLADAKLVRDCYEVWPTAAYGGGNLNFAVIAVDHVGRFVCGKVVVINPVRELWRDIDMATASIKIGVGNYCTSQPLISVDGKAVLKDTNYG